MKFPNIPTDKLGQWKYPKQVVRVPGNNITMQGIDHPNIGIADTGEKKIMMPGQNYHFPNAKSVVEVPVTDTLRPIISTEGIQRAMPELERLQQIQDVNLSTPQPNRPRPQPKEETWGGAMQKAFQGVKDWFTSDTPKAQNGIVKEGNQSIRTTWKSRETDNYKMSIYRDADGNMIPQLQIPSFYDNEGADGGRKWQNSAFNINTNQYNEWVKLPTEQLDSTITDHIQKQMQSKKKDKAQFGNLLYPPMRAQYGFTKEMVKGGASASDQNLLNIPMPSSAQESSIYRLGRLYEGGVKNWPQQTATGVPSKGAAADAQVLGKFPSLDLTQPVNAQRFVYGGHTGTGAKWRQPDWRFHQEQELMKLHMAEQDPASYSQYAQPWQIEADIKNKALAKTRNVMATQIDPILNSAYHEIGMSPDMRSMLLGNEPIDKKPQDVVREYNTAVDYTGGDKFKLGAKDESDYYSSYYQNVKGMSKTDAAAKAKQHVSEAAQYIPNAFDEKKGARSTYKYGGTSKGTVVEVEGNEIAVSLEKDGNFKKMWQTPASTPSHEEGGKDVVLPDNKLSMIFPQKYLGVINDALRRGDNQAIARYGQQMKAESEMAGALGLPFSNPPQAQYGAVNNDKLLKAYTDQDYSNLSSEEYKELRNIMPNVARMDSPGEYQAVQSLPTAEVWGDTSKEKAANIVGDIIGRNIMETANIGDAAAGEALNLIRGRGFDIGRLFPQIIREEISGTDSTQSSLAEGLTSKETVENYPLSTAALSTVASVLSPIAATSAASKLGKAASKMKFPTIQKIPRKQPQGLDSDLMREASNIAYAKELIKKYPEQTKDLARKLESGEPINWNELYKQGHKKAVTKNLPNPSIEDINFTKPPQFEGNIGYKKYTDDDYAKMMEEYVAEKLVKENPIADITKKEPFSFKETVRSSMKDVVGISRGVQDILTGRPIFETFPITQAQKASVKAKQQKAFDEGVGFAKDWFKKGDDVRPEVKSRMRNILNMIDEPNFFKDENLKLYGKAYNTDLSRDLYTKDWLKETTDILIDPTKKNLKEAVDKGDLSMSQAKSLYEDKNAFAAGINYSNPFHGGMSATFPKIGKFYYQKPSRIGETAAHETGHTAQRYFDWGEETTQWDPRVSSYYTPNPNTEIGKRFDKAMVNPLKPGLGSSLIDELTNKSWKASPNELHSELMKARLKYFQKLKETDNVGRTDDSFIKQMQELAQDDTHIDDLIKLGRLNRFFKLTTSKQERRDLIKLLPAMTGAIGTASLNQKDK